MVFCFIYSLFFREFIRIAVQSCLRSEQANQQSDDFSADKSDQDRGHHAQELNAGVACDQNSGKSAEESRHTVQIMNAAGIGAFDQLFHFR